MSNIGLVEILGSWKSLTSQSLNFLRFPFLFCTIKRFGLSGIVCIIRVLIDSLIVQIYILVIVPTLNHIHTIHTCIHILRPSIANPVLSIFEKEILINVFENNSPIKLSKLD